MQPSAIRFDRKWFNPLYFILNHIINDPTIRTVLVYGGKSSAKTASICQLLCKEAITKTASSIAFRKESASIPTTLKKSFKLAVETTRLYPAFQIQDRRLLADNRAEIVLKGIDSEEKAKGIESYKYLYLDELNHFEESEYRQFNLSLRGIKGQKIFASWNPVDENSWVKTMLIDPVEWLETNYSLPCPHSFVRISKDGKTVLIKTTYEDNFWITGSENKSWTVAGQQYTTDSTYGYRDENLIAEYEKERVLNFNSYKVNVLGEWGKTVYGGEFLKCWKSEKHTGVYPYDKDLAVWLSFDENTVPYFPCGIFQISNDQKTCRMIDAIALANPENKVPNMVATLIRKLNQWQHEGKIYITGDATSQKEDVKQEKGHDLFRQIINGLTAYQPNKKPVYKPERKTPASNPSVVMSAEFFNSILEVNTQGLNFGADKGCRKAIADFENTKEDKNGKVDKTTVEDPLTKIRYQPWGHFVDLTRYFICTAFSKEYHAYQRSTLGTNIKTSKNLGQSNSY